MSTDHNRIKVADLEQNQRDKILATNLSGEIEFKEINEISYNALDCNLTNKALDARQGKALKDLIDNINEVLASDNVNLDTLQKLADAIETVQISLNTILVNDLTTGGNTKALTAEMGKLLQTNKVDKVVGERLINAAEITKLSGLSNTNITTTVKIILSSVLTTQNVAGFVAYINALNPVLVVGNNEIVKYTTSDTGRTFELNLRGRSFGVGQPAIVAANVIETTEFLNKDIRLSNYPSTRNDGINPTNKVLGTDANGNLKLYTVATSPAPNLREISPSLCFPETTGNIIIKGSFFTPTMTVSITGQTVNYITFISDNEIYVNVTTGAAEGSFAVTLNNGVSATYNNALLILLGTVYKPTSTDWENRVGTINLSEEAKAQLVTEGVSGSAIYSKIMDVTKNWSIYLTIQRSPIKFYNTSIATDYFELINQTNGDVHRWDYREHISTGQEFYYSLNGGAKIPVGWIGNSLGSIPYRIRIYWNGTNLLWYDVNGNLRQTLAPITHNFKFKVGVQNFDFVNIKYIENF